MYYDSGAYFGRGDCVKNASTSPRMPDVGESKPFSASQLLFQNQTLSKQPLFCGIPSSTLADVDSNLLKRRQRLLHSSLSCSRPIPQCRAKALFAEKHYDIDPISRFSRAPSRVSKQIERSNYKWDSLLRHLDYIRCEADGLRCMVVTVKRDMDSDLKTVLQRLPYVSQSLASLAVPVPVYEKGKLRVSFFAPIFRSFG